MQNDDYTDYLKRDAVSSETKQKFKFKLASPRVYDKNIFIQYIYI